MSKNIAEGLGRMIGSKSAIDGAITAKGGVVTKGLENSATDIGTIPIPPPPVLIDKTITENGTYLPEDEYEMIILTNQTSPVELEDCNGDDAEITTLRGNTVQNGTPSPQNIVPVDGTGERTENWFDAMKVEKGRINSSTGTMEYAEDTPNLTYSETNNEFTITTRYAWRGFVTEYIDLQERPDFSYISDDGTFYAFTYAYDANKTYLGAITSNVPTGTKYIRVSIQCGTVVTNAKIKNIMLGSSLPYEPYGYKIGITNDSTTYNTYLGQVQTTRQIKKYEITGNEDWRKSSSIDGVFWINNFNNDYDNSLNNIISCKCTHYIAQENSTGVQNLIDKHICLYAYNTTGTQYHELYLRDTSYNTLESFIEYIQQQYAAGTPVTIWYVLANSTTGIVNEPLMKIGDYADTLTNVSIPTTEGDNTITVDTTVPPSSIDVSYHKSLGAEGYSSVTANVPNTYTAEDEGKVVSSGALVSQTAMSEEITDNGTVDTTLFNSVTVNVHTGVDPEPINAVLEEANDELEAALGGGGSIPVAKGQVNFYDYDGTIVKSMSSAQFRGLESMPANPSHEGLTAQGWNWSLSDAKAHVAKYGSLDIGQMYVTDDGKTRIYISLPEGRTSPVLMLYLNDNTELDIDWGDGGTHSTFTSTSADYKSERHNYPDKGDYVIAITVVSGSFILQSQSSSYNTFFTNGNNNRDSSDRAYLNSIQKIEIGTGISQIGLCAFYYCTSLSSITIPDGVTSIGQYAFQYCYSLSSVTIPEGVKSIGDTAFSACYSLISITLPNTLTSIGQYAFQNCSSLASVTIPDGVASIGKYAFSGCYSLSSITLPSTLTSIGQYAFQNCSSLASVTIPEGVKSIGDYTFQGCYSLSSVTLPSSVTSISQSAFTNCYSLSSITLPDSVTSIGNNAFGGCNSLSSVTIPDSVTSISDYTFRFCYSLSSVTLPEGVTSIGSQVFGSCYPLSSITIPDSVTSIGGSVFSGCSYMLYIKFESVTPPTVSNSNAWGGVSTSTRILIPINTYGAYTTATNYPNPSTYKYFVYGTYNAGDTLPTTTTDNYNLTWYASMDDAASQTNPISVGNGNEVYATCTPVT